MPTTPSAATGSQKTTLSDAQRIERRLRTLTPDQRRAVAEKVYALLRRDLRIDRERIALRHRLG